jgi:hypothetical protein
MILRFSEFILERYADDSRGLKFTLDEAVSFYNKNCTDWNLEIDQIYRGVVRSNDFDYSMHQPSKFDRVSRNTSNFYTRLLNILPSWKNYPKRSKSLICTTYLNDALNYANRRENNVFIIIPVNGAKIGLAGADDFWFSFPNISPAFSNMDDFNAWFKYFLQILYPDDYKYKIDELNKLDNNEFKELIREIGEVLITNPNIVESFENWMSRKFVYNYIDSKKDFLSYLDTLLNPKFNKFTLLTTKKQNILDKIAPSEVWTDGDCLLISYPKFEEFKNKVLQK